MLMELVTLKRGNAVLATVGATAPFVGLLGTVFGIITAFNSMATSGSGGITAIAAGIAEALIATGFGLIVAIPAVWCYNYFTTKIDNLFAECHTRRGALDYLSRLSGESVVRGSRASSHAAQVLPDLAVAGDLIAFGTHLWLV